MKNFNSLPPAQKISQATDGLETLRALVDLVKDPKPLLEAHANARKEAQMTEAQQAKYEDAVQFMAQAEQMQEQIANDRAVLSGDQETHQADVEAFKAWREGEIVRLKSEREEVEAAQRALTQAAKDLSAEAKRQQQEFSEKMTPIDDMRAQAERNVKETENELAKQRRITRKLEAKSSKVQKALADDGDEEAA